MASHTQAQSKDQLTFIFHAHIAPLNQSAALQHIQHMQCHSKPVRHHNHSLSLSLLVSVFPPPWELSKKPLVMLHSGQPEVKTLINISPAQPGEEKKKSTILVWCAVFTRNSGGEWEMHVTLHVYMCRNNSSTLNRSKDHCSILVCTSTKLGTHTQKIKLWCVKIVIFRLLHLQSSYLGTVSIWL